MCLETPHPPEPSSSQRDALMHLCLCFLSILWTGSRDTIERQTVSEGDILKYLLIGMILIYN